MNDKAKKPGAARKPRKKMDIPADETKAQKFVRLGIPRVTAALKRLELLKSLAGNSYECTPEQVTKIGDALRKGVNDVIDALEARANKKDGGKSGPSFNF